MALEITVVAGGGVLRIGAVEDMAADQAAETLGKRKAEKDGLSTGTTPLFAVRGTGGGESRRNPSRRSWTPKLLTALPKKTGVFFPPSTASRSKV